MQQKHCGKSDMCRKCQSRSKFFRHASNSTLLFLALAIGCGDNWRLVWRILLFFHLLRPWRKIPWYHDITYHGPLLHWTPTMQKPNTFDAMGTVSERNSWISLQRPKARSIYTGGSLPSVWLEWDGIKVNMNIGLKAKKHFGSINKPILCLDRNAKPVCYMYT